MSKKLLFLINGELSAIFLIFLLSIPAVRADDNENPDIYFYLADILCAISSICVCSKLIFPRIGAIRRCDMIFSINLISVTLGAFGTFLGRGRTIKDAIQGLISIILWLLPSILILPSHNNKGFEEFEMKNEILTSYINFLNIIRLYFFSGAGREMLTYIAISKVVSSLMGISRRLPNQLLLLVSFSLECRILFYRTSNPTIQSLLVSSLVSSWIISLIVWILRFRRMRIFPNKRRSKYIRKIFSDIRRSNYSKLFKRIFSSIRRSDYIGSIFPSIRHEFYRITIILVGLLIFGFCFDFFIYLFMIYMVYIFFGIGLNIIMHIFLSNFLIYSIPIIIFICILILCIEFRVKYPIGYFLIPIYFFTFNAYYNYVPTLYFQYTIYLAEKFVVDSNYFVTLLGDALFVLSPFLEEV